MIYVILIEFDFKYSSVCSFNYKYWIEYSFKKTKLLKDFFLMKIVRNATRI